VTSPEAVGEGVVGVSPLPVDSLGMWNLAASLPEQLSSAIEVSAKIDLDAIAMRPVTNVVAIGMGGSGIAGDVLAALAAPSAPVPVSVVKSYELPSFVGPDSLVFSLSCSGETSETLAATESALEVGAAIVAVTVGAKLGGLVDAAGFPVVPVPSSLTQPRAALAAMATPALVVLERLGLLEGVTGALKQSVDQLARRRDELVGAASPAAAIARRIGGTMPLIYGGPGLGAIAAQRWKTQINENAKAPAFFSRQPELCHNEIAGWGVNGDVTRQVFTLVTLRCPEEDPRIAKRFVLVEDIMLEVMADVIEVPSGGTGPLAQFFDHVITGDFVSLFLAGRESVDPGPVPVLSELKAATTSG
jgi:glucose/mannose-6-phosphate isomerase